MEKQALESSKEALAMYYDLCVDACEKAEAITANFQEDQSGVTELAKTVLHYARHLVQFDSMVFNAGHVVSRMAECVSEHPRLRLALMETGQEAAAKLAASPEGSIDAETLQSIKDEVDTLRANIQAADEGRWSDIKDERMLKYDPVEWTQAYEDAIDEADRRAFARLTDVPRGMGFCFGYWHAKKEALAELGVQWRTPHEMNPRVMFD